MGCILYLRDAKCYAKVASNISSEVLVLESTKLLGVGSEKCPIKFVFWVEGMRGSDSSSSCSLLLVLPKTAEGVVFSSSDITLCFFPK